jgi:hypothetical protein
MTMAFYAKLILSHQYKLPNQLPCPTVLKHWHILLQTSFVVDRDAVKSGNWEEEKRQKLVRDIVIQKHFLVN